MHIAYWIPKTINTHSEYVNTSCIATATMVAHTHLNVTLYLHFPSCFNLQDDSLFHCLDCCSVSLADFSISKLCFIGISQKSLVHTLSKSSNCLYSATKHIQSDCGTATGSSLLNNTQSSCSHHVVLAADVCAVQELFNRLCNSTVHKG